jgi:hypothetical protein
MHPKIRQGSKDPAVKPDRLQKHKRKREKNRLNGLTIRDFTQLWPEISALAWASFRESETIARV